MKKDVFDTLTIEELQQIVTAYVNLIDALEGKIPTGNLKKDLVGIFRRVPAITHTYGDNRRGSFRRYQIVKQVGSVTYEQGGLVTFDFNRCILLDPWTPDKDIQEEYKGLTEAAKQDYENPPTPKELAEKDATLQEKQFNNSLNKRNNLCLKYQVYKFLGKEFKVPKRFLFEGGKKFWEIAEILEQKMNETTYTEEAIRKLETAIRDGINMDVIDQLINSKQIFSINIPYFESDDDIETSYRQRNIIHEYRQENNYWIKRDPYYKEYYVSVTTLNHLNYENTSRHYSFINKILNLDYTLRSRKDSMPPVIREFLEVIGFIKPEEEDTTIGNDV